MALRTYTFRVRFRKGFKEGMLAGQAGLDRYVYNKLLEIFKEEYRRAGRVNTTRGRINA
ncbi:MAG: helix-turn-helix domain-containing protein [Cenarchaeum sp. SB0663_bin_5]|nr:helix-turn-helix domain-containing protein [Cenarchaeum sp. SB0663_bin_5]MYL11047.1 helix-turn-helix domain-containing protein [Cenarchaeum sp. SB0669_bin_11]